MLRYSSVFYLTLILTVQHCTAVYDNASTFNCKNDSRRIKSKVTREVKNIKPVLFVVYLLARQVSQKSHRKRCAFF